MPYSIIIRGISNTHPDPDTDRKVYAKKGDIVSIRALGVTANKIVPPNFVVVDVTDGMTELEAQQYRKEWVSDLQYSIQSSDTVNDVFRIELTNAAAGATLAAGITQAKVQAFLDDWNLSFVSESPNSVVFDADIYRAAISQAFWGIDPVLFAAVDFTQTAYDQGVHTIQADYSVLSGNPRIAKRVSKIITQRGGTLLSNSNNVATFTIDRATIRSAFQDDVSEKARFVWKYRRFSFAESDVDAAIAAGGRVSLTQAQVVAKLQDALSG